MKLIFLTLFVSLLTTHWNYAQNNGCDIPWNDPVQLSNDNFLSLSARISGLRDTIHVIWYNLDTSFTSPEAGIYYTHSYDGGNTFSPAQLLISSSSAITPALLTVKGEVVFVTFYGIMDSRVGTVIRRSTDMGKHWLMPRLIHEGSVPRIMIIFKSQIIIHYESLQSKLRGILVSEDDGESWRVINSSCPKFSDMTGMGNLLLAVGPDSPNDNTEVGFYTSINEGRSWYGPDIISAQDGISSLFPEVAASENGAIYSTWNEAGKIIFRRSITYDQDGNSVWEPEVTLSAEKYNMFPHLSISNRMVAVIWETGSDEKKNPVTRYSGNGGINFCSLQYPSPSSEGSEPSIMLNGTTIHAVWTSQTVEGNGIFYRRGKLTEFAESVSPILGQSYPNPASSDVTINVDMPFNESIEITLFNLLGQKIKKIFNGSAGPGTFSMTINTLDLASGIYFYRLTTRNSTETKKLVITR